ncbi:MAG: hypothetical protein H7346_16935 [Burkholderiaceae bacterium]|nr:hypothetical protein [Burkholderiaceae bacterium]
MANKQHFLRALPLVAAIASASLGMNAHAQLSIGGTTGARVGVGVGAGTANAGVGAGSSTSANGGSSGGINGGIATDTSVTGSSNYKGPAITRGTGPRATVKGSATSGAADNTDAASAPAKSTAAKVTKTSKRTVRRTTNTARTPGGAADAVNAQGEINTQSR